MTKHIYIFITLFLFACGTTNAQVTGEWQFAQLNNIDGTNAFNGVEGYFNLVTCNNNEYILLKLINHNTFTVKAAWSNFLISTDNEKLTSPVVQDSVTILPNQEIEGDCAVNDGKLVLKLTDFGTDKYNFQAYEPMNFDFRIIR
jgi:hypothetical protein